MTFSLGLFFSYVLSIIIMLGLPVALAFFVVRRFKVSWWVILTGVVTYIVSQVIHYPVLNKVVSFLQDGTLPLPADKWIPLLLAVIMGFLAALFEEGARYFGFLVVRKKTKKITSGIGLGIGHGGIESIGIAVWPYFPIFSGVLIQFLTILFYNPGAQLAKGVASEQVQLYMAQIAQVWQYPWHTGLLFGVERIIGITTQILLSVLVWKAIRNRNILWFLLAFFYHMLIEGVGVFLQYNGWSYWAVDGIMALFMLANLYLIYYFWKEESDKTREKDSAEDTDDEDDDDESEDDEEYDDEDEYDDDDDDDEVDEESDEEEDEEDEPDKA